MKDWEGMDRSFLGGPFDRQVRIQDWNQKKVEEQSVLVLGVGGLGSIVTINMLRLGVGKLFLVDYDVVDIHNLNRQLLYSHADVGKPKVEAAFKNAAFHNAGNTQIEYFNGNALTNWDKIVEFAKRSTFVYNCIDWGDKFDAAVSSLCLQLKLPLVMGGTFAISLTVDFFPQNGAPCFVCLDDTTRLYPQITDITPQKIMQYKDISFLPKNNNPVGRSSVIVCTICGEFMSSIFLNWLFLVQKKLLKTSRTFFYHNTFEFIKFEDLQIAKDCPFCKKYHPSPPVQEAKPNNEIEPVLDEQKKHDEKQEIKPNTEIEPVKGEQIKEDPQYNQKQPTKITEGEKKQ